MPPRSTRRALTRPILVVRSVDTGYSVFVVRGPLPDSDADVMAPGILADAKAQTRTTSAAHDVGSRPSGHGHALGARGGPGTRTDASAAPAAAPQRDMEAIRRKRLAKLSPKPTSSD